VKFVFFYHSLLSCWNHGDAHFLRGIMNALTGKGHEVVVYEPAEGWSLQNLLNDHGDEAVRGFYRAYPGFKTNFYAMNRLNLGRIIDGADVVIVHEWNEPELVRRIGRHRAVNGRFKLFFHDTHHRSVTDPAAMEKYDLTDYDGVLAYGGVIRDLYLENGWAARAWTWHEAADTEVFTPRRASRKQGDLVWIGNWGDEERTAELQEFLVKPAQSLGLRMRIHGVRYPKHALKRLDKAGIQYKGWLPNFRAPEVFARFRVTLHIPRRPYVKSLPGIPTIRPFEAMACGIPLICSPWEDAEGLFRPGVDYLVARNGTQMRKHLREVLNDRALARELRRNGLGTIRARHTCAHRADELLDIVAELHGEVENAKAI
jgi:spore maturation protein CgeB